MSNLIYPRDRALTIATMVIGVAVWCVVGAVVIIWGDASAAGTLSGSVLVAVIVSFCVYLFARSAAIAHLHGNAIEVSEHQLPKLHSQLARCCEVLGIKSRPTLFVQNGNGVLDTFATRFLGARYAILLSGVVDALEAGENGVRFYIGHELAHIVRHDNPVVALLRWPALRLPLLGAGFSRAREISRDLHGLACSASREAGARSLVALSAGATSWASVSLDGYRQQLASGGGFWMSFHELTSGYPWTVKRVIRVLDDKPQMPRRHPFAYVLALFVPYAGRMGAGIGLLLYVYFIGIAAAIAIPAYRTHAVRASLMTAINESQSARDKLARYYEANKQVPSSLEAAGIDAALPNDVELSLQANDMILTVKSRFGVLSFAPLLENNGRVTWLCHPDKSIAVQKLPDPCR